MHKRYYKLYKKSLSFKQASKHLTKLRNRHPWLEKGSRTAQTQALRNLYDAYKRFFKKQSGYPQYKSRMDVQKATFQDIKISEDRLSVFINKEIGYVYFYKNKAIKKRLNEFKINNKSRKNKVLPTPDSITLTKDRCGKYFISFSCLKETKDINKTYKSIGLDYGIHHIFTRSDGVKIDNPRYLKNKERSLRISQKALSRKQKDSKRREKARIKVAKQHKNVANLRKDTYNKLTLDLLKMFDIIFIEDLSTKNMMKNRKLAKSIHDASLGEITRQLEYKAVLYGKVVIKIDRWIASSKICSTCDVKNKELKLKDREWTCQACGDVHDRDINAAKNIERYGWLRYCRDNAPQDAGMHMSTRGTVDVKTNMEMMLDEVVVNNGAVVDEVFISNDYDRSPAGSRGEGHASENAEVLVN